MRKIPTLFKRGQETRLVTDEITTGCEWVFNEPSKVILTRKHDGTACLIRNNEIWKRYDCKKGKKPPAGFIPAQAPDKTTGHYPGWIKCDPNNPEDKYHFEGLLNRYKTIYAAIGYHDPFIHMENGTYELIGEKIQGNPEKIIGHRLVNHTSKFNILQEKLEDNEISFNGIKNYFSNKDMEGIVFYYGTLDSIRSPMCKIKKKDFGLKRGV